ncbi:MAG TPA: beta-galactosidase trimerization domain-containing protein, partial [Lacipirellulaceae bacterium]|nr:beta-galactosidase trimerization domain-containing protein [Lacipirellulaceae bacterium]
PLGWSVFSKNPQPGELRKICYQQLAHGADGQIWFRWRTCTVGREQHWHGLLGHDGKANRRYREAAQTAREYRKLAPYLAGTTPRPPVAILYDYDSIWAIKFQPGYPDAGHPNAIKRYYHALFRAGVNADIVRPGDDLAGYKLVLAPHLHVLRDDVAMQLEKFVRGGGVLLADCRTAVKDETNLAYDRTLPGLLSPALGIEIGEYESLSLGISDKETTKYGMQTDDPLGGAYTALHYADWISPTTAKAVARYDEPHLKEFAAVTRNEFGDGVGWYVGTIIEETEFYDKLIANILKDADIRPLDKPPAGVELALRQSDKRALLFAINHTADKQTLGVPAAKQELLSGDETGKTIELAAFDVAVIELPAADARRDE